MLSSQETFSKEVLCFLGLSKWDSFFFWECFHTRMSLQEGASRSSLIWDAFLTVHSSLQWHKGGEAEEYLREVGMERILLYAVIFAQVVASIESYKQTPTLSQIIFRLLFNQYFIFIYLHILRTSGEHRSSHGACSALGRKPIWAPVSLFSGHLENSKDINTPPPLPCTGRRYGHHHQHCISLWICLLGCCSSSQLSENWASWIRAQRGESFFGIWSIRWQHKVRVSGDMEKMWC